jgi:hypothetical protein
MKNNIYDRISTTTTAELIELRKIWRRLVESQTGTQRHNYHSKCLTRSTLELERRGALGGSSSPTDFSGSSEKEIQ